MSTHPIRGKTLALTFKDGQMAGQTVTHAFHADGSLEFQMGDDASKKTRVEKYEVAKVSDDVYAVAYLGSSGYTLTTVLNFANHHLLAFGSNDKSLEMSHGSFVSS